MILPSISRWTALHGAKVLVRVDFNCPVSGEGAGRRVTDDFRIRAALPLLIELKNAGASVTVCTHFGRPAGRPDERYSVEPVRRRLNELIEGVELLENLRFHPGEESNDPSFGTELVRGYDFYVNEAFGASHRAHASIMVPPTLVPSAAGPNLVREVDAISTALESPKRPLVAIVGGAKVKDKLGIVKSLVDRADTVIVGGGMAYTFSVALGRKIGDSLFDASFVEDCAILLETGKVLIPIDGWALPTGTPFGSGDGGVAPTRFEHDVPDGWQGLDIGPSTADLFAQSISQAGTLLWNGPMGVFEDPRFRSGTERVARAVASSDAYSIVGGGDSVAAIQMFGLEDQVSFVSTGGGASLELVEFGDLPGLRALRESPWN